MYVVGSTTRRSAARKQELNLARHGKMSPQILYARYVVPVKMIFHRQNKKQ